MAGARLSRLSEVIRALHIANVTLGLALTLFFALLVHTQNLSESSSKIRYTTCLLYLFQQALGQARHQIPRRRISSVHPTIRLPRFKSTRSHSTHRVHRAVQLCT